MCAGKEVHKEDDDKVDSFAPGSKVKAWGIKEDPKARFVKISGSRVSIPKLRSHYGKELCWAVAATRLSGKKALACCPHVGKKGHPDSLHNVDPAKHKAYVDKFIEFRYKATSDSTQSGAASLASGAEGSGNY